MSRTGFAYPEHAADGAATACQPLRRPLTPLLRVALPKGVVGPRQGRSMAFNPLYVNGAAYGGLVGGVDEAARLVMLQDRPKDQSLDQPKCQPDTSLLPALCESLYLSIMICSGNRVGV